MGVLQARHFHDMQLRNGLQCGSCDLHLAADLFGESLVLGGIIRLHEFFDQLLNALETCSKFGVIDRQDHAQIVRMSLTHCH